MIAYLLKSTLCLLVTIGFFKIGLEKEQMPRFKRWYLLITLLFSGVIPFVSLPAVLPASLVATNQPNSELGPELAGFLAHTVTASSEQTSVSYGWWLYGIVTTVLLARFIGHGYSLARQIRVNPKQPFGQATLVCLDQDTLPYTFLHYLFVSRTAYQQGKIEPELFTHELAHIRQRHTLDILLIELLLCFSWFNPLIYWYKQAIQLNHEFLADQAVLRIHRNVTQYQQLLVSKSTLARRASLISTLTFQITKKRLMMMTRQTSMIRSRLTGAGVVLLLSSLTIGIGTSVSAQVAPVSGGTNKAAAGQSPASDVAQLERRYGNKMVIVPNSASRTMSRKKFSDLSASEKQHVHLIPPLPRLSVTDGQLIDWKNAKKYGIWIDDKRVPNDQLSQYTAPDFGSYFSSKLARNAINYGKHYYQIDLMTTQKYEQYVKEQESDPMLVLSERNRKSR